MFRGGLRLKLLIFNRRKWKIQSNREIRNASEDMRDSEDMYFKHKYQLKVLYK